jgi:hypothetical protein
LDEKPDGDGRVDGGERDLDVDREDSNEEDFQLTVVLHINEIMIHSKLTVLLNMNMNML